MSLISKAKVKRAKVARVARVNMEAYDIVNEIGGEDRDKISL